MRVEYNFSLQRVDVPRFSVESTEGPHKLFTLASLVLNVLHEKSRVDVVFHSANPDEPKRKIATFLDIVKSAPGAPKLSSTEGGAGRAGGVYFQWLSIRTNGAGG